MKLDLEILLGEFAICRLDGGAPIPEWSRGEFISIVRTNNELSIVCETKYVPSTVKSERGWSCIKVAGPLNLSLTGILASLASPLALTGISIFAISTFDTDYLLVKAVDVEKAKKVLSEEGHSFKERGLYA